MSAIGKLASTPWVYDQVQALLGVAESRRRLAPYFAGFAGRTVLDVGAGTGLYASLVPPSADYVAIDIDPQKLRRLREKVPGGTADVADATDLPYRNGTFDAAICIAVAHHLTDEKLVRLVDELGRVVTETLVFVDPVLAPSLRSRLLWRLDRGAHPRTCENLVAALERRFEGRHVECYATHHRYLLFVGTPRVRLAGPEEHDLPDNPG